MSIQAVESQSVSVGKGIKRGIDAGAEGMIMEIVQSTQYTKPIPSCVRELASNAVDSQNEKAKAIKINNGEAKPEDYFIERDGDLYADSNWDASYYNFDHLSDKTKVELEYVNGEGLGRCDKFIVRDHGVGIGGKRLKVLVDVGVSTKRNRTDAIGGFGIGSRSPLSTGAEYYNTVCVYNGLKISLKTFSNKMDSLIGKFNSNGELNTPVTLPDGHVIYAEKTNEKNYTEVTVPCLKREKNDFMRGVKDQLMFFDDIVFSEIYQDGIKRDINFKANITYESDDILIAENMPFSYPFVVITNGDSKICYGMIDFDELGTERKRGSVGIKCSIRQVKIENNTEVILKDGVDVIPSREALRWNENTRNHIFYKFGQAQKEASKMVAEKLKTDNYLDWIESCQSVFYRGGNTVLNSLYCIIDKSKVESKYQFKNGLKAKFISPQENIGAFARSRGIDKVYRKKKYVIDRKEDNFSLSNVYYADPGTMCVTKKDEYIISEHYSFNLITLSEEMGRDTYSRLKQTMFELNTPFEAVVEAREEIYEEIKKKYPKYEDVEVPEYFGQSTTSSDESRYQSAYYLTPAEKRKLNQEVSVGKLRRNLNMPDHNNGTHHYFVRESYDMKVADIKALDKESYWYATSENSDKLHLAAILSYSPEHLILNQHEEMLKVKSFFLVSKTVAKYFDDDRNVDNFFGRIEEREDGKVEFKWDPTLDQWRTAMHFMNKRYLLDRRYLHRSVTHCVDAKTKPNEKYLVNKDMRDRVSYLRMFLSRFDFPYNILKDSYYNSEDLMGFIDNVSSKNNLEKYGLKDKEIDIFPKGMDSLYVKMHTEFTDWVTKVDGFLSTHIMETNYTSMGQEKLYIAVSDGILFIEAKMSQAGYSYPDDDSLVFHCARENDAAERLKAQNEKQNKTK
jgi:hypothetical protein